MKPVEHRRLAEKQLHDALVVLQREPVDPGDPDDDYEADLIAGLTGLAIAAVHALIAAAPADPQDATFTPAVKDL